MSRRGVLLREFGFANLGLAVAWFVSIVAGLMLLMRYENHPGPQTSSRSDWPASTSLTLSDEQPTVVLFVHPHCPCSRATISELARVVANCENMASISLVAYEPKPTNQDWRKSRVISSARTIPGVRVHWDQSGNQARLFQVQTSGHLLLYDRSGKLRFSGGITASRGHEGSSLGRSHVESWLQNCCCNRVQPNELLHAPVFGCPLVDGSGEMTP